MAIYHHHSPWTLPVGCYSIIVRHDAVIRRFPGGVREFERVHRPVRADWVLFMLIALSDEALDRVLAQLEEVGLKLGVDVAVADKMRSPILRCPGVTFDKEPGPSHTGWTVRLAHGPLPSPPVTQPSLRPPAGFEGSLGDRGATTPSLDGWVFLGAQEGFGMVDSWDEYLFARPTADSILLDIFRDEWLGEVPYDWFDDDGEPLPEHQDANGRLRLPATWEGRTVTGEKYGGVVGELEATGPGDVKLQTLTIATVSEALVRLRWQGSEPLEVLVGLRRLLERTANDEGQSDGQ